MKRAGKLTIATGLALFAVGCALPDYFPSLSLAESNTETRHIAANPLLSAEHLAPPLIEVANIQWSTEGHQLRIAPGVCLSGTGAMPAGTAQLLFHAQNQFEERGYRLVSLEGPQLLAVVETAELHWPDSRTPHKALKTELAAPAVQLNGAALQRCLNSAQRLAFSLEEPLESTAGAVWSPLLQISLYDAASGNLMWSGRAAGRTEAVNRVLGFQLPLRALLRELPQAQATGPDSNDGKMGLSFMVVSDEGRIFWPYVIAVTPGSPLDRAGLLPGDVLLSINNEPAGNRSTIDIVSMLYSAKAPFGIKAQRGKQTLQLTINSTERPGRIGFPQ